MNKSKRGFFKMTYRSDKHVSTDKFFKRQKYLKPRMKKTQHCRCSFQALALQDTAIHYSSAINEKCMSLFP